MFEAPLLDNPPLKGTDVKCDILTTPRLRIATWRHRGGQIFLLNYPVSKGISSSITHNIRQDF